MSERGPYKANIHISGPYKETTTEAWAYRNGTGFETHAQVVIGDQLYHITVTVPKLRGRTAAQEQEKE